MNTQPTPETDRIVRNAEIADHPPTRLAATLTVKCEQLERERDEAWEEIKNLQGAYDDATNYYARIIELIDERDEAREKYTALATENMLAVNKLAEERDEARAVAAELASAASHCLGWHDCRLNIGEKIAAALKRWKKSK